MASRSTKSTSTRSGRGAAATANKKRNRSIANEADEYVEVKGGGDFPDTWDFDENPELVGVYLSTEEKDIKGEPRIIHHFEVDGEEFTAWGAAILNSRLADIDEGSRVKVVSTGNRIPTKRGKPAKEFKVYVARGALRRGA